jgi:LysR family hydrogen peroxide-inducible transcriptional activator
MAIESLVANNPQLRKVPLAEEGPHREIAFIVRPNYPSLDNIELMINLFKQLLSDHFKRK